MSIEALSSSMADVTSRIAAIQAGFGISATTGQAAASTGRSADGGQPALGSSGSTSPTFADSLRSAQTDYATPGGAGSSATGEAVVAAAERYLGVPYVYGGNSPQTGLDCSGLTKLVYSQFGVDLKRVSWDQAQQGTAVDGLAQAKPGDLLCFGTPAHHVAIYAGGGKMVEAPHTGLRVRVTNVYETPSSIRRLLPDSPGTSSTPSGPTLSVTGPGTLPALAGYAGPVGAVPYAAEFTAAGTRYGIPARVLAAVARTESGYRADAVCSAGARGLMQLMPSTARSLGVDPVDPAQAIDGAARLLAANLRDFGSLDLALAAHNAGVGAVRRYGGVPPFPETRGYISKINALLEGTAA